MFAVWLTGDVVEEDTEVDDSTRLGVGLLKVVGDHGLQVGDAREHQLQHNLQVPKQLVVFDLRNLEATDIRPYLCDIAEAVGLGDKSLQRRLFHERVICVRDQGDLLGVETHE